MTSDLEAWQVWGAAADLVEKKMCRRCRGSTDMVYHKRCETLQQLGRRLRANGKEARDGVRYQLEDAEKHALEDKADPFWEEQADRLRRVLEGAS